MADASVWQPGADVAVVQAVVDAMTSPSSSTIIIGAGIKSLVVQPAQLFIVGNFVMIVDAIDINNYMEGQIVTYDRVTGALTVNVASTAFVGSGTRSSWTVTVTGLQGLSGSISGTISGNVNFLGLVTMAQTLAVTGAVTLGSSLTLNAAPTTPLGAANKQYVDDVLPIGTLIDAIVSFPPNAKFVECNGQAISRTTYATLFSFIGVGYGAGDGTSTFNVPNLARRVTMGAGGTATAVIGNTVGYMGGEETHTLTIGEIPSHNHSIKVAGVGALVAGGTRNFVDLAQTTLSATEWNGGSQAHNVIQPTMVVSKWVKAL